MTDIKERLRLYPMHGTLEAEALERIEELEARLAVVDQAMEQRCRDAVAAERERINVAVTRAMCGYGPDDPLWHTIDHVAKVMEAAKERDG